MYDSHNIAKGIKEAAKAKNVIIKDMLSDLELGSNSMSAMYHGKMIASDSLAKIADYLGVSVDYLLGRSASLDSPESVQSPDTAELIDIYNELSPVDRAKLLVFADELRSKGK